MTSKREDILAHIETILAGTVNAGSRVFRGRPDPARSNEIPCIFYRWLTDRPDYDQLSIMDWDLVIELSILVQGANVEAAADAICVSMHSLLMADRSLGGRVQDILPGEQRMDIITGDKPQGTLKTQWKIRHRTAQNGLDS